ncbi:hypothetical protein [Treponema vincentii]|uniref:hypothetical protein n=1 Tax=Treponema vincentii TaxID=69710 RepID=UPI0020A32C7B|nr:hypothetical protein [Treponema vincentii]UTC49314.1 hypothetical protein E4N73_11000 [Treponema vincentii]
MPLPFIIGAIAAAAGAAGVGAGIHGAVKMKEASNTVKSAQRRNEENVARLEDSNKRTMQTMDNLGKYEMEIISTFERFSTAFEKIKNLPSFNEIKKDNVTLSVFTPQEVKDAAVGASVLLAGLGGAALGTAGGFAAAGGTTAAVMALGTASTGTAISALSGVAATNATLAALGGGSLAAGGGGIALGTAVLGGATLGVGLLIGGIIFSVAGSSVSDKADKAWDQMIENEKKIDSICDYLDKLENIAKSFHSALSKVNDVYMNHLVKLEAIIEEQKKRKFFLTRLFSKKVNYNKFSDEQRQITKNTILLVGLLYEMCKVQLVEKTENSSELNKINEETVINQIEQSEEALLKIDSVA